MIRRILILAFAIVAIWFEINLGFWLLGTMWLAATPMLETNRVG